MPDAKCKTRKENEKTMLAFRVTDIINVPIGFIVGLLYKLANNYAAATILFGVCVCLLMYPLAKKKRINSIHRAQIAPLEKKIEEMFAGNVKLQNKLVMDLYEKANVTITGGWALTILQFVLLITLYEIVIHPVAYVLGAGRDAADKLIELALIHAPEIFATDVYQEITVAKHLASLAEIPEIKAFIAESMANVSIASVNYSLFGVDLSEMMRLGGEMNATGIGLLVLWGANMLLMIAPGLIRWIKGAFTGNAAKITLPGILTTGFMMILFTSASLFVPGIILLYWLVKTCTDYVLNIFMKRSIAKLPPLDIDIEGMLAKADDTVDEDFLAKAFYPEDKKHSEEHLASSTEAAQ